MSINRVVLSGNLTRDPEMNATASGSVVMRLGVAVNDRRRNPQTQEWEDYANFVNCTMFGKRAEALGPRLHKGQKVTIEGKLHYSEWTDKNTGAKRSKIEVWIDEIEFMSPRDGGSYGQGNYSQGGGYNQSSYNQGGYSSNQRSAAPAPAPQVSDTYDEDIPF